jgi:hypothetical protein
MDQGQERKDTAWNAKEGAAHGPSAAQRRIEQKLESLVRATP